MFTSTFPPIVFAKRSSNFVWLVESRCVCESLRSGDPSGAAEVFYKREFKLYLETDKRWRKRTTYSYLILDFNKFQSVCREISLQLLNGHKNLVHSVNVIHQSYPRQQISHTVPATGCMFPPDQNSIFYSSTSTRHGNYDKPNYVCSPGKNDSSNNYLRICCLCSKAIKISILPLNYLSKDRRLRFFPDECWLLYAYKQVFCIKKD